MMKLYYSSTLSPYARKVLVVLQEKGIDSTVEKILISPYDNEEEVRKLNPLGKIPILQTESHGLIYDSVVISEFLDNAFAGPRLFPQGDGERWRDLRLMTLADGVTDAAVSYVLETRRVEAEQSISWKERWTRSIESGLNDLASQLSDADPHVSIGRIAAGCTLGYLEFRLGDGWRAGRESLAVWFDRFCQRISMRSTVPKL